MGYHLGQVLICLWTFIQCSLLFARLWTLLNSLPVLSVYAGDLCSSLSKYVLLWCSWSTSWLQHFFGHPWMDLYRTFLFCIFLLLRFLMLPGLTQSFHFCIICLLKYLPVMVPYSDCFYFPQSSCFLRYYYLLDSISPRCEREYNNISILLFIERY